MFQKNSTGSPSGTSVARLRLPLAAKPAPLYLEPYRRYGDVVRFQFIGFRGAILHGAEANRYILDRRRRQLSG